jgi:hypothetical protein
VSDDLLKRLRRIWPIPAGEKVPAERVADEPKANGDSPDSMPAERSCVDCGVTPPQTESEYTLISAQHGWRLSRGVTASGRTRLDWRCPKCWAKRKGGSRST